MDDHSNDKPSWLDEVIDENTTLTSPNRGTSPNRASGDRDSRQSGYRQSHLPRLSQVPTRMSMAHREPNDIPAWAQDPDLETSGFTGEASVAGGSVPDLGGDADGMRCCVCYDPILCPFWILHGMAGLVGLGTAVVNATALTDLSDGVMPVVGRAYAVLFGLLVIFVETDCGFVLEYVRALEFWAIRGLFYIFVGVETMKSDDTAGPGGTEGVRSEALCGGMLGVIGLIYFVMGVCCIQHIKQNRQRHLRDRESYQLVGADGGGDDPTCYWWKLCHIC